MRLRGTTPCACYAFVCLLVAGGLIGVDDGFVRRYRACDLRRPTSCVTDPQALEPSARGLVRWRSGVDLPVSLGRLDPGDLLKVKLSSPAGVQSIQVSVDDQPIAELVVGLHWRQHEIILPVAGQTLRLNRVDSAGPGIDLSRLSVANTLGHASGVFEVALRSDLSNSGGRKVEALSAVSVAGLPPLLFGLVLGFARRFGPSPETALRVACLSLTPSAALVALGAAATLVSDIRVSYPGRTFALLVLVPMAATAAVIARQSLASSLKRTMSLLARLPWRRGVGVLVEPERWQPATASLVGACALALLTLVAVLLLPRSPYEWDEVLFLRAMDHFDVAEHSPHPPGYPLYIAAAHCVDALIRDPMRSLQLVSVLGAVATLLGLVLLMRRLGATRTATAAAGLLLVAMPAFSFHANVGMSDALATGLAMIALWAFAESLSRDGGSAWFVAAASAAALALGTRPQVVALLFGPCVVATVHVVRRRRWRLLVTATAAGAAICAACWIPPIAATGWHRYFATIRGYRAWILEHEVNGHLPRAPIWPLIDSWFIRPFGTPWLALLVWGLVVTGSFAWWAAGRRQLTVLTGLGAAGYFGFALWRLQYDACVRYANPVLPCLAALAAGVVMVRRRWLRGVLAGAAGALAVLQVAWAAPVHLLRARDAAPVWSTLGWVRDNANPETTQVIFAGVIRPHSTYLLGRGPLVAETNDSPRAKRLPGPEVWLVGPLRWLPPGEVLHSEEWPSVTLRRLTRNRYHDCGVVRRPRASEPALVESLPQGQWSLEGKRAVGLEAASPPCSLRVRPTRGTIVISRSGQELVAVNAGADAELPLLPVSDGGIELAPRGPSAELTTELVIAPPAQVSTRTQFVPSVAWTVGERGELWRSDLELSNAGPRPLTCRLTFIPAGGGRSSISTAVVPVAPMTRLPLPGVVRSIFASSSSGAIAIEAEDDNLRVESTMHRVLPDGSRHSARMPVASTTDALDSRHPGEVAVPTALAAGRSRASVGLVNLGPTTARVAVEVTQGGRSAPTTLTTSVAPWSCRRLSVPQMLRGSLVRIQPETEGVLILAHASIVDESSGDWLFLPIVPHDPSPH